jgi:hypothetical protein
MLVFAPINAYTWCKNGIFDCFGKAKRKTPQKFSERLFLLRSDRKIRAKRCSKICVLKGFLPAVFYAKTPPPTPPKSKAEMPILSPFYMNPIF